MRQTLAAIAILACMALGPPGWAEEPMAPAGTQPATRPSPEGLKALSDLAAKPLRLTNDAQSAHAKYSYAVAINPPEAGDAQSTTVLVVRDGDHFGVVVGAKGLPFYYMTDGLLVAVDRKNPGQLMIHEGGSVQLLFSGKEGAAEGHLQYSTKREKSSLVLDPSALCTAVATKVTQMEYLPAEHKLGVQTSAGDSLKIRLTPAGKVDAYPIESLMFQGRGPQGLMFIFGNVTPNVLLKKSIASRSVEDVRKLGLPIRKVADEELQDFPAPAPRDFAALDDEQEAAEKLKGLFPDD